MLLLGKVSILKRLKMVGISRYMSVEKDREPLLKPKACPMTFGLFIVEPNKPFMVGKPKIEKEGWLRWDVSGGWVSRVKSKKPK